jgi:hypothetical protein
MVGVVREMRPLALRVGVVRPCLKQQHVQTAGG